MCIRDRSRPGRTMGSSPDPPGDESQGRDAVVGMLEEQEEEIAGGSREILQVAASEELHGSGIGMQGRGLRRIDHAVTPMDQGKEGVVLPEAEQRGPSIQSLVEDAPGGEGGPSEG